MKRAILFGATGLVGSHLLVLLLEHPEYEQVVAIVRRSLPTQHSKLKVVVGDFHSLENLKSELKGEDLFLALGTTKASTPDENDYHQIDHDYPVLAAKLAKENGAKAVFLVSAVGANQKSGQFYLRSKGVTEQDIIALDYDHTVIFRPSMIMGERREHRPMEKALVKAFSILNPLLRGPLERYKGIDSRLIAKAMVNAALAPSGKVEIQHWKEMRG